MVKGRHIVKIWVVAPLPALRGRAFHDVFLMVLLPISDQVTSVTFERLDLFQVRLRDSKMGDQSLSSPAEIAQRLNWTMRKFRLV
jgi:hypothetical protein